MLFKILKLFGLDVPARIEAVKASLELRVEQATDHVKRVAQEAAVIAALSVVATVTAGAASGVGLIALYLWTADAYGVYVGLGVVGAILVVVTAAVATAAAIKAKSLASNGIVPGRYAAGTADMASDPAIVASAATAEVAAAEPRSDAFARLSAAAAMPAAPIASAGDLVEPLGFLLSKVVKYPASGNPRVDELIGHLAATAHGTADEAVNRAANVIRHGDRSNLVVVLTGAALVGWLLAHHSRQ